MSEAMNERVVLKNSCYVIPLREKAYFFAMRLVLIPYLILRYKLRRFLPTDMEGPGDVARTYIRDYEARKVLKALGIDDRDATAAVKVASYMHNLTNPLGEITELTPERSMRVEKYCPFAKRFSPETCKDLVSGPAFRGLCEAINPNLVHSHTNYLSGGDDCCDLCFELKV